MVINNAKIILPDRIIDLGHVQIQNGIIQAIKEHSYEGNDTEVIDGMNRILMPGFIDLHIHGSCGIDFMDADVDDYKTIAQSLYQEGTTTFLATTLTSDFESLKKVCETVSKAINVIPSLGGIHFEGPYINVKYKGAQNEAYIRNPSIDEFDQLQQISNHHIRYITLAPEKEGALSFIRHVSKQHVTVSAGHSDATFDQIEEAIKEGLSNTTHTHNAMSGHHHRNPGIVTAAMYFDSLYTEMICDGIHVCPDTLKTFYKIVGPDRFIIVTDALLGKHSDIQTFKLFGLDCIKKNDAAYLTSGPLAGSLLNMDQGVRNVRKYTNASLIDLAKISSTNAAKAIHLDDRGEIKEGKLADLVLLDDHLQICEVYKKGKRVY